MARHSISRTFPPPSAICPDGTREADAETRTYSVRHQAVLPFRDSARASRQAGVGMRSSSTPERPSSARGNLRNCCSRTCAVRRIRRRVRWQTGRRAVPAAAPGMRRRFASAASPNSAVTRNGKAAGAVAPLSPANRAARSAAAAAPRNTAAASAMCIACAAQAAPWRCQAMWRAARNTCSRRPSRRRPIPNTPPAGGDRRQAHVFEIFLVFKIPPGHGDLQPGLFADPPQAVSSESSRTGTGGRTRGSSCDGPPSPRPATSTA